MSEWEPEIEVDELRAQAVIARQFVHLDTSTLRRVGEGWDYTIWATADAVAFRFPRRRIVLDGMRREMAVLPWLDRRLPAAVPNARYQGAPSPEFEWPFFGSDLIRGLELTEAEIPVRERVPLAQDLGAFLNVLHALAPPDELIDVIDPNRRADMGLRVPRAREMIDQIRSDWPAANRAESILSAAEQLGPDPRTVLSHGDLHLRQILVTDDRRLSGVVDWVDICRAPASVDLSVLWSLFSPHERETFLAAYGPVDPDTLLRARALALFLSAALAAYAQDRGHAQLWKETLAQLDRVLTD